MFNSRGLFGGSFVPDVGLFGVLFGFELYSAFKKLWPAPLFDHFWRFSE